MTAPNFIIDPADATYENVTENLQWLEDKGKYSRYDIGCESSVWVCHACQCHAHDVNPDEEECGCYELEFWS
jgi:hypothetical protein